MWKRLAMVARWVFVGIHVAFLVVPGSLMLVGSRLGSMSAEMAAMATALVAMVVLGVASVPWWVWWVWLLWVARREARRLGFKGDFQFHDPYGWVGEHGDREIRLSIGWGGFRVRVAHLTSARGAANGLFALRRLPASLCEAPVVGAALAEADRRGLSPHLKVDGDAVVLQFQPFCEASYDDLGRLVGAGVAVAEHLDRAAPSGAGRRPEPRGA